ncbi:OsmC family protein [Mesobacterium pallidum]|uniref:OsmC family protein n=1 Tax=Mesobacterium pallidum TaxID=2872037 RepID=UPI001EE17704|nr:OsmC family protein [Mesobacterium pallidum]
MQTDTQIRAAQAQVIARMEADPDPCRKTYVTTGRIGAGLACEVRQGRHAIVTDLGPAMGGGALGPSPGFLGRAAIVGCVGIGVKMMALREGLTFDAMTITVETEFDDTALMGLGANSAAPLRTRVRIEIDSPESAAQVAAVVDRALEQDPWFLALRDAQVVEPCLTVRSPTGVLPG